MSELFLDGVPSKTQREWTAKKIQFNKQFSSPKLGMSELFFDGVPSKTQREWTVNHKYNLTNNFGQLLQ